MVEVLQPQGESIVDRILEQAKTEFGNIQKRLSETKNALSQNIFAVEKVKSEVDPIAEAENAGNGDPVITDEQLEELTDLDTQAEADEADFLSQDQTDVEI